MVLRIAEGSLDWGGAMDVALTGEQELLRETTAKFIDATCPLRRVRELAETDAVPDRGYLAKAAELGWFAMLVPEDLGGGSVSGRGVADAGLVAEERGRVLQPCAFVAANVVAFALAEAGRDHHRSKVLPGIVNGEQIVAWAWEPATLSATTSGGSVRLTGTASGLQDAHLADHLLVTATSGGGLTQVLVPRGASGVRVEPLDGLDLTRSLSRVHFDGAEVDADEVVGAPEGAEALFERQFQIALVLAVSESVGAMARDFAIALDYSKLRTAFGRPIGSFQAVKHQLADASMLLEASMAITSDAVRAVQDAAADAAELASAAKAFVGDAAIDVAQTCFQVFGGIGYTWEHDQHLYMRRLTADAALYGQPSWHRERICRIHGL
jgi:alkylation response protein AidB-like acyl-CoA dehydrogenase